MPALRRIFGMGCLRLTMHQDTCELCFPQVDRMFSCRSGERKAINLRMLTNSDAVGHEPIGRS
jgi:hypothetical protein